VTAVYFVIIRLREDGDSIGGKRYALELIGILFGVTMETFRKSSE